MVLHIFGMCKSMVLQKSTYNRILPRGVYQVLCMCLCAWAGEGVLCVRLSVCAYKNL